MSLIIQAAGRWQWDDYNHTRLPIATTDLNENQQDYVLEVDHLEITRMEVQDLDGNWHKLKPIDQVDVRETSLTDYLKSPGLPIFYDKLANSIFLYPKSNYSMDQGLKVYYERGPDYFVTTDTTKEPGFNSLYHDLIPLWIAYDFALANGKSNAAGLLGEIQQREEALKEDYTLRGKDDHIRLRAAPHSFR